MPYAVFAATCIALAGLKAGIAGALPFFPIRDAVETFPLPNAGLSGLSLGMRGLARLFGTYEEATYFILGVVVTGVAFVVFAWTARISGGSFRLKASLLILGPLGVLLLGNIGRHDALFVIGAAVIVGGYRRLLLVVAGSLILILANPEQAPLACLSLLLLTGAESFRDLRRPATVAFISSSVAALALFAWSAVLPQSTSRADFLGPLLGGSLLNFMTNAPLVIYSALGVLWLMWLGVMANGSWRDRAFVAAATMVPLLATAVTFDQTRVAICLSSLMILSLTFHGLTPAYQFLHSLGCTRPQVVLGGLALVAPSIEVTFAGHPRAPFGWIAEQLGLRR